MRRLTRALGAFVPALSLAVLGLGVTAGPASAAGCYGYGCHGYDLYHFGCTYNITKSAAAVDYKTGVVDAYVYNRYSSGCNSNWTEAQLTPAGYAAGDSIVAETFTPTTDSHGTSEVMYDPTNYGNEGLLDEPASTPYYHGTSSIYTDMVDGTNLVSSYIGVYNGTTQVAQAQATQ